jgi:ribA/ribD-fused uncharacterized protein
MSSSGIVPKFKPFTKTKVTLALEATPLPLEVKTDIATFHPRKFRDAEGATADEGRGEVDGEPVQSEPEMFKKRQREAEPRAPKAKPDAADLAARAAARADAGKAFPGLLQRARQGRGVPGAPVQPRVYSRLNVLSRDVQAAQVGRLPQALQALSKTLLDTETANPYIIEPAPDTFFPISRRGFGSFLINQYGPIFPKGNQKLLDVAKCAAKGEEGKKEVKIYHYQAFIREYLRFETPYRGLLVYHGLGSGKTCSAIAAAEALFGTRGSRVIVMTPFSLRDNFISEISFCGFKHFRLQNHWVALSLNEGSEFDPEMVKIFAKNVYGIPDSYFVKRGKGREQLTRIWVPDFDKESEPNFDSLSAQEKDEITTQIKATIENRITFINYNGITATELKRMVCSTPEIFDNAVIVVDEIHNLTRLMQGSLEYYFVNKGGRRTAPVEKLTVDRQALPLCGQAKKYQRGYLFYRLFMDAKNTKVIGLSGTPLINFPEELGILMNILHGPIHTFEMTVKVEPMRDVRTIIEKAVALNEDLDTVFFQVSEGSLTATLTRLPEEFSKVFGDDSELLGIRRREPGKIAPTLAQVYATLETALKADRVVIKTKPVFKAQELLPAWDSTFRGAFLQEDGITLKNDIVLKKRIRGLVSYYRGIQGNVMPRVTKDEIVSVPLTGYALKLYNKYRNQEIQIEMSKPAAAGPTAGDAIWAEIAEIATAKTSSNYRMSSRQACNFVFPDGISRPRPRNLDELDAETGKDRDLIVDNDIEDQAAGRNESAEEAAAEAEDVQVAAEVAAEEGVGAVGAAAGAIQGTREAAEAYRRAIRQSKDALRKIGPTHLQLDGPADKNLARYSPKFAAMLERIRGLPGSSLVYSQFLEMEGIGIFGICMEANGFVPIEINQGADGKLQFSQRTATSLAKGPAANEMRYIEFTGTGSKEQRAAAVNFFNARFDKLSPSMQKVLTDAKWKNNYKGELCRVFCITSAGAEGLSLKCVRGVHIMEPYWNTVRTQQVKGRAVRICSHMDLPQDQQTVEIFTYCTVIPEEAMKAQAVDKTLERSDSYNAKDAAALGVPVPREAVEGVAVPEGMFEAVEAVPVGLAAPGAAAAVDGPIKFYSKLANEFRGFSNFAPSPMVIRGKRYATVEHYFQSMKFVSPMWQEAIRVAPTPARAKQLGASKDYEIRDDWQKIREPIMLEALRAKFKQNAGLLQQLKDTGARPLVEAGPDAFWGEGRLKNGKNRLGKLLMQVREEMKDVVAAPVAPVAAEAVAAPLSEEAAFAGENGPEEEIAGAAVEPLAAAGAEPLAAGDEAEEAEQAEDDAEEAAEQEAKQFGGAKDDERTIILTSDQRVLLISLRKERVITSLQTLMKSVAVDCELNYVDNNDGSFRCLNLGDSIGDFAYHPDLQKDIAETEAKFKRPAPAAPAAPAPAAPAAPVAPVAEPAAKPNAVAEQAVLPEPEGPAVSQIVKLPPAPVAAAATNEEAVEAAAALVKPKPKRINYRKTEYFYQIRKDGTGKPLGYLLFNTTDSELTRPVGYVEANPATGLPKGPVVEPPTE